jgi:hypothetical protein
MLIVGFEIELLDDRAPRGYWGSRLRGGFGETLRTQLLRQNRSASVSRGRSALRM